MPKKREPTLSDIAFHLYLPRINFDDDVKKVENRGGTGPKTINAKNTTMRANIKKRKERWSKGI